MQVFSMTQHIYIMLQPNISVEYLVSDSASCRQTDARFPGQAHPSTAWASDTRFPAGPSHAGLSGQIDARSPGPADSRSGCNVSLTCAVSRHASIQHEPITRDSGRTPDPSSGNPAAKSAQCSNSITSTDSTTE